MRTYLERVRKARIVQASRMYVEAATHTQHNMMMCTVLPRTIFCVRACKHAVCAHEIFLMVCVCSSLVSVDCVFRFVSRTSIIDLGINIIHTIHAINVCTHWRCLVVCSSQGQTCGQQVSQAELRVEGDCWRCN